jgi:hypothetical protein
MLKEGGVGEPARLPCAELKGVATTLELRELLPEPDADPEAESRRVGMKILSGPSTLEVEQLGVISGREIKLMFERSLRSDDSWLPPRGCMTLSSFS